MNIAKLLKYEALKSQKIAKCHSNNGKYNRPISAYEHHLGISIKQVIRRLKERQDHPIIILDVMCEGGNTVRELNRNYQVTAFGVDLLYYPEYQDSQFQDRFIVTPAKDMSMIPDESIDLVLNLNGYTCFPDIYKTVKESLRVLAGGGELYSVPFGSREETWNSYSREGNDAIEEYERETDKRLKYKSTRRLSWHRFPPVRMSPVLSLIKQ